MKPLKFKEHNQQLGPPQGMSEDECASLPVFTDGKQCISCWELSPEEIDKVKRTGRIWLSVMSGKTQPPVWLSAEETVFFEKPDFPIHLN
ncbi:MAG: hypothetical protein KGZ82_04340 [Bacteroidales bacterium]|nr:hypothetical protein [Bacteroidales bacterium]